MTVHANDVAWVIREALEATPMVGSLGELHVTPNPEQCFQNRDGRLEFVTVGRDCIRGFRITVETIPLDEAFAEADRAN